MLAGVSMKINIQLRLFFYKLEMQTLCEICIWKNNGKLCRVHGTREFHFFFKDELHIWCVFAWIACVHIIYL